MRVLVTGASGFLGINLVRRFASAGASVGALVRRDPDDLALGYLGESAARVKWEIGDVLDRDACADLVSRTRPDVVVHAAAVTQAPEEERRAPAVTFDVNAGGTLNVLEAARVNGRIRFVYVSSGAVYGPAAPQPALAEDAPLQTSGMYAIAKLASERLCIRYHELGLLDTCIGRMGTGYGPMERRTGSRSGTSAVHRAVHAALDGTRWGPLRVAGAEIARDFIHVEDVVDAFWHLSTAAGLQERVYNVGAPDSRPLSEALELLAREVEGFSWLPVAQDAEPDLVQTPQNARSAMDLSRIRRDTSWHLRYDLEGGVIAYLNWCRANPRA